MRTFLRICVGLSFIGHRPTPYALQRDSQMTHPLHPLTQPSLTTHAYAYIPTPMRGTLTHRPTPHAHNYTDHAYAWWSRQTTHMRGRVTPDHAYAYARDSHPFGHGPTPHAHNYTDHAYAYAWDSHPLATDQHSTHTTTQTTHMHMRGNHICTK
ncbi:hypothetical protein PIB30_106491, partial [Stylosanthes scabra]|nr:hypothetical protein [Stylosanthes scabra]